MWLVGLLAVWLVACLEATALFYEGFSMRRREHPVFYHSNSSSDLKMTQNELQNELKMSLGSPPAPKVAKVCPRTPSSQTPRDHLEPKWLPKGVNFEAKIEFKIVLMSGVEKVGDLEAQGSPNGPSRPQKSMKTI